MATAAQMHANQQNAQHATGPRTPEGKQRSSHNATRHGLCSRQVVLRPGEQAEYETLHQHYFEETQPEGILELTVFQNLIHAAWTLRRARQIEAEWAQSGTDPLTDPDLAKDVDRLSRYAAKAERSFYRALKELRLLQTHRAQRAAVLPSVERTIPPVADVAQAVEAKGNTPDETDMLIASMDKQPFILWAESVRLRQAQAAAEQNEPNSKGEPAAPTHRESSIANR